MKKLLRSAASVLAVSAGVAMLATDALATEGYFQHAYGLRHKALAGAGVASAEDATAISLNPAGLVDVGNQYNTGVSLFMPFRKFSASGTNMLPAGVTEKSKKNIFPVPTTAYVRQIDEDSAFAISIFGNGGMNTTYTKQYYRNAGVCGSSAGYFNALCGTGDLGVDLMQMFVSAAYARRLTDGFSIGIAPIFAIQRFKAYGLQAFTGISADPNNVTNRGYDYSFGGGVRVGMQLKPTDWMSFGASYQTKMWMSKFDKYSGLFAQGGDFDIPANLQVGVAFQLLPELKLMVDYRRVFYSDVKSISNSMLSTATGLACLGGSECSGFGWRDTNTIKVGIEYQATQDLILRAGYSYMWPQAMGSESVVFNTLAPGVIRHQFTGGATYRVNEKNDIDFAFMIAPTGKQSGSEYTVSPTTGQWVQTAGSEVELKMYQIEVSLGWTYNFDGSSRAR